jgi:hypothetical protein
MVYAPLFLVQKRIDIFYLFLAIEPPASRLSGSQPAAQHRELLFADLECVNPCHSGFYAALDQ